jgi:hypothetical protein
MKYPDFIMSLDILQRMYPKYYSNELLILADDVLRWLGEEFPQDSSALAYLKSIYDSPYEALEDVWTKIQLILGAIMDVN